MKLFPRVDLIKVERDEWPRVKATLLLKGYIEARLDCIGGHFDLWTADKKTCVSSYSVDDNCYWIDIRVAKDLGELNLVQ